MADNSMSKILILYHTTDGQTLKICRRIQQVLEAAGDALTFLPIADAGRADLPAFDMIVIGASIRYGRHNPAVVDFVERHRALLDARPNAFFSVNLVARKPGKNRPETNPYVRKFLKRISWRPKAVAVFAGKLDYPRYGSFDRWIIRLIMAITGGPTDPAAVVEYTDWAEVDAFAGLIADMKNPA
jgi:menaquinone-dependent protoporphyrinogen oxidase